MDKEVVWTLLATTDLESIVEYILRDSEAYAAAVARELMAAGRSLATLSERGRIVAEYEDPRGTRTNRSPISPHLSGALRPR
jgi:plasmid stabilization system protein ParE